MNIAFVGYGHMAKAIARGLIGKGNYTLSAAAPSLIPGINIEQIRTHHDNKEVIKEADVIILAVKPIHMSSVLEQIIPNLPPNCLLISVAAGLNLSWFAKHGVKTQALIRTMPNTPAAVGLAATPMFANTFTTPEQKQCAEHIFSCIGITTWAEKEEDIDTFTALSGSGPAYVFLFIEAIVNAAVKLGLTEPVAKTFTLQTLNGALKLAQDSDLSLNQLRTRVTSPGGTTAAALNILHGQLDALILSAMTAAKLRSKELGSRS